MLSHINGGYTHLQHPRGNRLEPLQAFEFALEMFPALEVTPMDDFDGAQSAEGIFRQPHFAAAAAADLTSWEASVNVELSECVSGDFGPANPSVRSLFNDIEIHIPIHDKRFLRRHQSSQFKKPRPAMLPKTASTGTDRVTPTVRWAESGED